ncbi:MAG TPA: hypothetical protein DEA08_10460, partial [Planctomycetes bacterium]|nr:hypothetical protein [Planctomycetota bacterium]
TFAFHPEPPPPALLEAIEQGQTLTIDPNGLLLEAARRLDESEQSASVTETWGSSVRIRRGFLAGSLSGVGLAAVLQTLQAERLSGTLSISGDEGEQQLYFKRGEAFLFRRDDTDAESLREFLGESWEEKVVFARHSGATGCVHEDDLPEVEVEALKEAFFDTLFWHDAQFEFLLDALPEDFEEPEGATRIALHSSRFLLQVVGRLQEWDELSREVGGEQAVYRFATPAAKLEAVQTFGPPELLTLIDGRISLGELARRTGLEILEVARVVRDLRTINLIARV